MKIKEKTRKLAAGCSKHCLEVVDRIDEVSSKHVFEVVDKTDEVSNHTYGKATLAWFEEILEEYQRQVLFSFERLSVNFLAIYDKMGVSQKMTHRIQF